MATIIVFLLIHLTPGDAALAIAGEQATPEQVAQIREDLGLNDPLPVQYWNWLSQALQGDLGESIRTREPVWDAVSRTLPTTLHIVVGGLVVAAVIGIPAGIASAKRANRPADQAITSASAAGVAMPNFWLGLILVSFFALRLNWLPATGFVGITEDPVESIKHLVLPAIAVGVVGAAEVTRQLRAAMIEVLDADFIRTHRAKGLRSRSIVWRHAFKNASVPLVTILGLRINRLLGATVVIEAVFGIAGLGNLVVGATLQKDFPIIQGVILTMVVIVVFTNLLVDITYRLIDPRIR
ncbi:MAG: ABC transporter permease subunit [Acidimicrobiia bacterium]|nr:ABC transporter permease subunit [Acidimicrobiia bacterium]